MKHKLLFPLFLFIILVNYAAFAKPDINDGSKAASIFTKNINQNFINTLPFAETTDYIDAKRGFIANSSNSKIKSISGETVWDLNRFNFESAPTPDSVNPSLWSQAQLNNNTGLFKVAEHIYQIRGFDISNMSIIEGNTGLIIIDPLISKETASAALKLYYNYRPHKPIIAIIYSHSHIDHFGGVAGIIKKADVIAGKIKIIAPLNFMENAISENVYAGNAMSRRATYMYGAYLPANDKGLVDSGIGKTNSHGTPSLIAPTKSISKTGTKMHIDGIELVFQYVPNTEAPTEMNIYFPQWHILDIAEDATKTMHNIYTLRGAQVRDALAWSKSLDEVLDLYGNSVQILFTQHTWPTWGNDKIIQQLKDQRDMYKYIHDQTLYMINQGYTSSEIAEKITLPSSLANKWYNREYYGTIKANSKAIYQKYIGWYDGNPVNLDQLPSNIASKKYIEYMGNDITAIINKAQNDYNNGEYRWVAQIMNHIIAIDPKNVAAAQLEADALEQLGYQAEAGPWRNEYLMGAFELRHGLGKMDLLTSANPDVIDAMSLSQFFDNLSIHLNANRAANKKITINWIFTDLKTTYAITLENSVLLYKKNYYNPKADTNISLSKKELHKIILNRPNLINEINNKNIKISGNSNKLKELLSLFDQFNIKFSLLTPNQ